MILTITMNPSIDSIYFTKHFELGTMTRFASPVRYVGGKGINCGRASALLGSSVILTGFLGGYFGSMIQDMLKNENLFDLHFLHIAEESRGAVTIMHDDETQTELVEAGPEIADTTIKKLMNDIKQISKNNYLSVITINGSVNNPDPFLYAKLLQYIKEQIDPSTYILMDISGQHLREVLASKYKPMFIKPNIHEFSDIIHQKITQKSDIKHHLKTNPLFKDIDVIMVSCGSYGAVVKVKEEFWNVEIPKIPITNTTGSGDATVGGFAHSLEQNYPLKECIRYAMACGMSNAQQSEVGKVIPADVKNLAKNIKITEMK